MARLEIVRHANVVFLGGYGGDKRVQVTELRVGDMTAYVREWRRTSSVEQFALSSNARLGHKADGDRIGDEVLHLAAPEHAWERIAELVAAADSMRRPVVRHQRWTMRTAPEALADIPASTSRPTGGAHSPARSTSTPPTRTRRSR